jgi:predicted phage-related endonuclease
VNVQVQHQLIVTGVTYGYVAVLLTGNRIRWQRVERDSAIQDRIIVATKEIWERIENVEPIPADGSEATKNALRVLYPHDTGETVPLSGELQTKSAELEEMKRVRRELEKDIRAIENEVKAALGFATFGTFPDGSGYSLKTTPEKVIEAYTRKPFRTLRYLKAK